MFSRYLFKSAIPAIAILITGCQTLNSKLTSPVLAQNKPKIVASHSVLCHFLDTIAADTIDLSCSIEGGQDPHAFRPTPSHRKAIEEAQVIFYGGYDLEPPIIDLIEGVAEKIPAIAVYETVVTDPIMAEKHEHGHDEHGHDEHGHDEHGHDEHGHDEHGHDEHGHDENGHDEHGHEAEAKEDSHSEETELTADPHIWHDVNNAIAMVEYLQSSMLQINPTQAALYLENAAALREELVQLHPWIQEQIATIPEGKKILVTTHNALNYYVRAYELDSYQTLQGLSPEDSASASDLRNLVEEIKQNQVPTIFAETTASDRVINNVAREAGVEISDTKLLVDGLGAKGTKTDTYSKMMVSNTCAIVNGLGGECQPFSP